MISDQQSQWRRALEGLTPRPTEMIFCCSLTVGAYIFAVVATLLRWEPRPLFEANAVGLEYTVVVVQAATILYLAYVAHRYIYGGEVQNLRQFVRTLLAIIVIVVGAVVGVALVEALLLKPSFGTSRPENELLEHMTGVYGWLVSWTRGAKTGAPSGFTMRQVLISLWTVLFIAQPEWHGRPDWPRRGFLLSRWSAYGLAIGSMLLVTVSRIVSGAHYPYDVAVGIGFGVFLFWWMLFTGGLLLRSDEEIRRYARRFMVPGGFFAIVHIFLTTDFRRWALFSGLTLLSLALAEQRQGVSPKESYTEINKTLLGALREK